MVKWLHVEATFDLPFVIHLCTVPLLLCCMIPRSIFIFKDGIGKAFDQSLLLAWFWARNDAIESACGRAFSVYTPCSPHQSLSISRGMPKNSTLHSLPGGRVIVRGILGGWVGRLHSVYGMRISSESAGELSSLVLVEHGAHSFWRVLIESHNCSLGSRVASDLAILILDSSVLVYYTSRSYLLAGVFVQIAPRWCIPRLLLSSICIDRSTNELVLIRRTSSSYCYSLLVPLLCGGIAIVEVVEGGSLTHFVLEDEEVGLRVVQTSVAARLRLLVRTPYQDKVTQYIGYNSFD